MAASSAAAPRAPHATDMLCLLCRYFMVGGSDAGMVGSRSVAATGAWGSLKASLRGGPFGPGGLGFDPTLGEDAGSITPIAGETSFTRSGQDPNAQQSGVSQVGHSVASVLCAHRALGSKAAECGLILRQAISLCRWL